MLSPGRELMNSLHNHVLVNLIDVNPESVQSAIQETLHQPDKEHTLSMQGLKDGGSIVRRVGLTHGCLFQIPLCTAR